MTLNRPLPPLRGNFGLLAVLATVEYVQSGLPPRADIVLSTARRSNRLFLECRSCVVRSPVGPPEELSPIHAYESFHRLHTLEHDIYL